ncbi:MAG: 6,7-dimethyl-8-ribityllumazine synthase [Candidatus Nitrosocaldus sp.]|nr:6,7-dimethyl-8-ribityllumazine synthase [Candidatus Nitrosocaldus sp.]MCS7141390.1 6,7-dimethyl-8-ribityllumazine synthase [Candidatus Nitrosocaldus sp.]MDW8000752.1 6,7-dimethyl-8-ribityllumazine synthase [Candidatus Nitrosocaldus sp.]MDW8275707.1 6,7-dimethyl-8-ribityllumazine synthase [Candidatus Nitrosocaldus sp.]
MTRDANFTDPIRLGVVVAEFNGEITSSMLDRACKHAKELDAEIRYICYAPGTFDMPLFVEGLLSRDDVDAVVTLGAVIKGETMHDEVVAFNASRLIADLALRYGKPVALGISGPGMSYEQAMDRINPVSTRAVSAAVSMVRRLRMLKGIDSNMERGEGTGTMVIR